MNYRVVMSVKYPNKKYYCEDTYESLVWYENEPKPTDDKLKSYWEEIKHEYFKEIMRHERNVLLMSCDFCALPDYPDREKWIQYRKELRDFPSIWVEGMPFPTPPQ